jgi:hypothetical protein
VGADVDHLVLRLLATHGVSSRPPVDIELVAARLGVSGIVTRAMTEHGRLERHDGATTIYVRGDTNPARRRFTVAHELGHLVLEDSDRDFVAKRSWLRDDRVERFCDEFAAALILPRAWIIGQWAGAPRRLPTLRAIQQQSGASLAASLVRVRALLDWQVSLLHWRRRDDRWAMAYTAGVPFELHNRITSAPSTTSTLDALPEHHDTVTRLPLKVAGHEQLVSTQISIRHNNAIALAYLEPFASSSAAPR